jgi:hypothetical protein
LTAVSAISSIGCSTVVSGGEVQAAASIPSKPTTEGKFPQQHGCPKATGSELQV